MRIKLQRNLYGFSDLPHVLFRNVTFSITKSEIRGSIFIKKHRNLAKFALFRICPKPGSVGDRWHYLVMPGGALLSGTGT